MEIPSQDFVPCIVCKCVRHCDQVPKKEEKKKPIRKSLSSSRGQIWEFLMFTGRPKSETSHVGHRQNGKEGRVQETKFNQAHARGGCRTRSPINPDPHVSRFPRCRLVRTYNTNKISHYNLGTMSLHHTWVFSESFMLSAHRQMQESVCSNPLGLVMPPPSLASPWEELSSG